ncbi:hypothetical protein BX659_12073 [Orenia metallireducens]|jgi:hypothetical protein|uniref:Uncharacterized protein n=1 Tax=Orenia metallireducens TaxID=1413210 RepID=A0A285GZL5_9FIRM|nr:hypothetical protein [Orenia metallireducens]PRX26482.1 hypothetical protein BX659_12073 [Orenia metallireducens]SNY28908.1 hypothetical protein SAMN06265827_11273 [Orenia metallireducens]
MTLGYPDKILPYPAVEYIPLSIRTKKFNDNWANRYQSKLYILDNQTESKAVLNRLGISYPENIDFNKNLLILLLNGRVEDIYYRGYKVQMIGKQIDNSYHLFTITKEYFYKDKLIFNFFLETGELIAKERYQL